MQPHSMRSRHSSASHVGLISLLTLTTDLFPPKSRLKIGGVPYYIVGSGDGEGKRYALSGAQPVASFVKVVERVLAERPQGSQ